MVNKAILIGNVGQDPEVKVFENGMKTAKFSLATSETYKNKQGEKVTNTEWHNVVAFDGLANVIESFVKKGSKLYIEGKIVTRSWESDGVKKYTTEIKCNSLQMLDAKAPSNRTQPEQGQGQDNEDDLPF